MLKKVISLFIIGMVFIVGITSVFAYSLLGSKYRNSSIQYQYDSIDSNRALNSWESRTKNVTFFESSATNQGIIMGSYNAGNTGWNGICYNILGKDGYHLRSIITGNNYYMDSMSTNERQGVYAHEIGHALGLDHVKDTAQVMCTWADGRAVYLPGSDDVAGANYLY